MEVFYPAYYEQFRCIASSCPDSCCKEWTVDIDPDSADFYRSLPGKLGDKLRSVISDQDGSAVMTIENGRCPMWQPDGLCQIQAELGHDALCKTCRDFPRLYHDYGNFAEQGLELSCPEAAKLILGANRHEMLVREHSGSAEPEYDTEIMAILKSSRQEVLAFLDDPSRSVGKALAAILLYSHHVQYALDGGEITATLSSCYASCQQFQCDGTMSSVLEFFRSLEILTESWRGRLAQTSEKITWGAELRALARYLIERYWLQAISDYDLVCRVKLVAVSCLLVSALGGNVVQTAQLFSKEIENNPDNVESILSGAYTAQALTDANLLALLLA